MNYSINSTRKASLFFISTLLTSTAWFITQASADASLDELKARLERAEKENIILKTEKLERENITMKLEKIEAENAALRNEAKVDKTPTASIYAQKQATVTKNPLSPKVNLEARKDPIEVRTPTSRENVAARRENNHVSDNIPEDDPRHDMVATSQKPLLSADKEASSAFAGYYGGLNVGYGWGTGNQASTTSAPLYDNSYGISGLQANTTILQPVNTGLNISANTGSTNLSPSGLQGGIQVGYNWVVDGRFLAGIETDVQGSTISGGGTYSGKTAVETGVSRYSNNSYVDTNTTTFNGNGTVTAGLSWLGTTRGRLGWLALQNLLLYGTGGVAYGAVYASSTNSTLYNIGTVSTDGVSTYRYNYAYPSFTGGNGNYTSNKVGYVAGAGLEWMFRTNWSLKAEALYYNLGTSTFAANAVGLTQMAAVIPFTRVRYDGVIARAGVNYHFSSDVSPVSMKY